MNSGYDPLAGGGDEDMSAAILRYVGSVEPLAIIRRYDVDFDAPLRNSLAVGMLNMAGAFNPLPILHAGDTRDVYDTALVSTVGAHWCDIVRADVGYQLLDGLRLVNASREDAEQLHVMWRKGPAQGADDETVAYVVARWFDGCGKIRYRLGAYTRARISFQTALTVVRRARLWWLQPDIQSNFLRGRFEELRQAMQPGASLRQGVSRLAVGCRALDKRCRSEAEARDIDVDRPGDVAARRPRDLKALEFLRGYSSVLHNTAVALADQGRFDASIALSERALTISRELHDEYRQAQALNHQAILAGKVQDEVSSEELFREVTRGQWQRGALIARQNLARLKGGAGGLRDLRGLLDELRRDSPGVGRTAGTDIDFHAYTVRAFDDTARAMSGRRLSVRLEKEVSGRRLEMARSVRQVVALPTYKRGYATGIRPTYLAATDSALQAGATATGAARDAKHDEAMSLVEESSARELLDMMSSASMPTLGPPPRLPAEVVAAVSSPAPRGIADGWEERRGGMRRLTGRAINPLTKVLARRAEEFEAAFIRQPLDVAPHDPEITHKVMMFAANHPEACIVRYFVSGDSSRNRPLRLSAFVIRGRSLQVTTAVPYERVTELTRALSTASAPGSELAACMWDLFLSEVWPLALQGQTPLRHLIVVPTDDLFAIPLQLAQPAGGDAPPLGVRVPLSFSVSATAFVARGRHMLKRQVVDEDDDLAAVVLRDAGVSGEEIVDVDWRTERVTVAGDPPPGLPVGNGGATVHEGTWKGVAELTRLKPEFFVYAGHGQYVDAVAELGPVLQLRNSVVTQYDVALRLRLPRNKLTVLGACLAGQGIHAAGGEVAGFLRSLMAAGAGVIALPLWSVLDEAMVDTVRTLLRSSRRAICEGDGIFDVVESLQRHYAEVGHVWANIDAAACAERMPLTLYL